MKWLVGVDDLLLESALSRAVNLPAVELRKQAERIGYANRIATCVRIKIRPSGESNRIGLGIPPPPCPIPSEDVVIQTAPILRELAWEAERLVDRGAGA